MTRRIVGMISLAFLIVILLACAFPQLLTSHDPNAINFDEKFSSPNRLHPMGTDELGRDLFARVLYGGRVTIGSSLIIAVASMLMATIWSALSAYTGGIWDEVMTRITDILMIIPTLLFALLLVSILTPGMRSLVLALTLVRWPSYARILRGQIFSILNAEYLVAAVSIGAKPLRIIRRHVIPNTMFLVVTLFGLNFASSILGLSSLSFLGFGVQLPQAEWGAMINAARPFLQLHPYLMFFPGVAIITTILFTNLSVRFLEPYEQRT
jgi:peptide/nickel transport system permease protein